MVHVLKKKKKHKKNCNDYINIKKVSLKQEILPGMSKIIILMTNVNLSIDSVIPIQNLNGFFVKIDSWLKILDGNFWVLRKILTLDWKTKCY